MESTIRAILPAVPPMVFYCFLQIPVAVIGSLIVKDQEIGWNEVLKSWVLGQMLCYAVLQVIAVPMILLRMRFDTLFWSYLGVIGIVFGFGIYGLKRRKIQLSIKKEGWTWLALILTLITIVLILWQSGNYFFGIHLDEDDARWLAEANDALEYGDMMTRSFYTGELGSKFVMYEDVTSPWPMMSAVASRILHTRISIFAHTIYPAVAILTMYGVHWLIGTELFKKTESRLSFLFFTAILILFYGGEGYSQGAFSLIRIWQGKSSVAGVIIPVLLYLFISLNKDNEINDWIAAMITALAACLMSGMGIFISALMIGIYGLYNILAYQNWERIPFWLASLAPSVVFYLAHVIAKG